MGLSQKLLEALPCNEIFSIAERQTSTMARYVLRLENDMVGVLWCLEMGANTKGIGHMIGRMVEDV
jgi:hypothetical protein